MRKMGKYILIVLLLTLVAVSFFACTPKDYGVIIEDDEATVDGVVDIALTSVKNTYYLGEFFDRSQYVVKAILNTGEVKEIPFDDAVKVEGFNSFVVGSNTFTVRYGAASTTYSINVVEPEIASIKLATMPTKTQYIEGEKLDVDGCTLDITLKNTGTVVRVGITNGFVSGFDSLEIGKKDLIINFCGTKIALNQAVEVREKSLVSVSVKKMPDVTEYFTDSVSFQKAGMVFEFTYDNDDKELVDVQAIDEQDLTFEYQFTTPHSHSPVIINYTTEVLGERKTFSMVIYCSVSDKLVQSIVMSKTPDVGTTLLEGREDMDYTGGILRIYYQDGQTYDDIPMTSPIFTKSVYKKDANSIIPADLSEPGEYYVRFSYYRNDSREWYYNLDVTVVAKQAVSMSLTNTQEATQTKYYAGLDEGVNINNLRYVLQYNNNTQSAPLSITESMLKEGSDLSVVDGAGHISGNEITLSYEKYVIDGMDVRNITGDKVGEIDKTNMTFDVYGDKYTYDQSGTIYGYKKIAFSTQGVSAVLKVMVYKQEVISISVINAPSNAFIPINATTLGDMQGLSLRVKYNHGGEETVTAPADANIEVTFESGSTNPSAELGLASLPQGSHYLECPLYVSYKGRSTNVDGKRISFKAYFTDMQAPTYNEMLNPPTTGYIYGDNVRLHGMQFTVISNGEEETVTVIADDNVNKLVTFEVRSADNTTRTIELSKSAFVKSDSYAVIKTGEYEFNYFGALFRVTMTVTPLFVSSIVVQDVSAVNTLYNVNQEFGNLDNIVLSVTKNNGRSEDVTTSPVRITDVSQMYRNGYYYIFADDITTAGAKKVTIYYKENANVVKVDYYGILYKVGNYTIERLAIHDSAGRSLYDGTREVYDMGSVAAGMTINLSAYRLLITYSTGIQELINLESSMLNYTVFYEGQGDRKIILTYDNMTLTNIVINVVRANLTHISVDTETMQLDYIVGSMFSYEGGYIKRYYADTLDPDVIPLAEGKITGFDSNVPFAQNEKYIEQKLTIEYGSQTSSIYVKIWNKQKLDLTNVKFIGTDANFGTGKEPQITIERPNEIFETPNYMLRYQYQRADGSWEYIDANNSTYTYYIGRNADGTWAYDYKQTYIVGTYQTRNLRPHHAGTYRVVFSTQGNDYYDAVEDGSVWSTFEIGAFPLDISADAKAITYGDQPLDLTFSITGDSEIEQFAVKTLGIAYYGDIACIGDGINVGSYTIGIGTLSHPYFSISFTNSTYTVNPREITVTPLNLQNLLFTEADLSGTILFEIKAGNTVLVESTNDPAVLAEYFSMSFNSADGTLTDIGTYTMTLSVKTNTDGSANNVFSNNSYTATYAVEVYKKIRVLEIKDVDEAITFTNNGNEYTFSLNFATLGGYDTSTLAWTTKSEDYSAGYTVATNATYTVTYDVVPKEQVFYFKYNETDLYQETAQLRVVIKL